MKIDLGSFAFGSIVLSGGNTPSWGTSLGQSRPALKLTYPGCENIVIGMVYKSIPVDKVYIPLGKGGHVCNSLEDEGIQLAAMFEKVYVNEKRVNASFIMLIYKEDSNNWKGRKTLKYSTKIEYRRGINDIVYNSDFVSAARDALNLAEDACWLISDIFIVNQDELHMIAGIVNPDQSETYPTTELRKAAFINAIKATYDDNPHFKKMLCIDDSSLLGNKCENLQQIFYGAPGTGKSHEIKKLTTGEDVIRTTFHPDSDYSTFVGAYKPSMATSDNIYGVQELKLKLKDLKETGNYPCQKFGTKYWRSVKKLTTDEIKDILSDCGFTDNMATEISKGIAIGEKYLNKKDDGRIIYAFVPQAFTNAYVKAWSTTEDVFLIIEEINRGNCAQIFGDLFQLLDRNDDGFSEYPVDADNDLANYLQEHLANSPRTDIPEEVKSGEKLKLPNNLYIWATMNTSDQSLFPIDSAFKRRWNWKYIPISDHEDKNYKIDIKGTIYDWWGFLEKINQVIGSTTSSEDKKLGYFFCKAKDGVIDAETFVSKVLFYLWNDVFKNYGFDNAIFNKVEKERIAFSDFFTQNGDPNPEMVKKFLKNLDEAINKDKSFKETKEETPVQPTAENSEPANGTEA